jgi:hypothetical protein
MNPTYTITSASTSVIQSAPPAERYFPARYTTNQEVVHRSLNRGEEPGTEKESKLPLLLGKNSRGAQNYKQYLCFYNTIFVTRYVTELTTVTLTEIEFFKKSL